MDGQVNIFSYIQHNPIDNSCCVIMDGTCQDITWQELFDSSSYDTLRCVTYVSSGTFFEKTAGKFNKVQIIIGIEKSDVKRAFGESIRSRMYGEGAKFFSSLSDKAKNRIISSELELRYSTTDTIIHSKFYLLSNSKTGDNRVIIGSANLTRSAFENNISQYEDVLVFNNSEYFNIYNARFQSLYSKTVDYIPDSTIQSYKEGKLISIADFTPEEKTEHLLETLRRENIIPLINEGVLQSIQEVQDEDVKEQTEVKASFEVIAATSKKSRKNGSYVIKIKQQNGRRNCVRRSDDSHSKHLLYAGIRIPGAAGKRVYFLCNRKI